MTGVGQAESVLAGLVLAFATVFSLGIGLFATIRAVPSTVCASARKTAKSIVGGWIARKNNCFYY